MSLNTNSNTVLIGDMIGYQGGCAITPENINNPLIRNFFANKPNSELSLLPDKKVKLVCSGPEVLAEFTKYLQDHGIDLSKKDALNYREDTNTEAQQIQYTGDPERDQKIQQQQQEINAIKTAVRNMRAPVEIEERAKAIKKVAKNNDKNIGTDNDDDFVAETLTIATKAKQETSQEQLDEKHYRYDQNGNMLKKYFRMLFKKLSTWLFGGVEYIETFDDLDVEEEIIIVKPKVVSQPATTTNNNINTSITYKFGQTNINEPVASMPSAKKPEELSENIDKSTPIKYKILVEG